MAVGTATTYLEFEFYEFEQPAEDEVPQPFTVNEDGTVDLDLSGDAIFRKDVDVKGDLIVQTVNILEEIQDIKTDIQAIKTYLGI
jgi:hypothetical protein